MASKKFEFKKITLQDMKEYIEENAPQDKAWFKKEAFDDKGKYQHLVAVRAFCDRYMPDIIPVAKPKAPKVSEILKDW